MLCSHTIIFGLLHSNSERSSSSVKRTTNSLKVNKVITIMNDAEEIKRLNEKLDAQENTIRGLKGQAKGYKRTTQPDQRQTQSPPVIMNQSVTGVARAAQQKTIYELTNDELLNKQSLQAVNFNIPSMGGNRLREGFLHVGSKSMAICTTPPFPGPSTSIPLEGQLNLLFCMPLIIQKLIEKAGTSPQLLDDIRKIYSDKPFSTSIRLAFLEELNMGLQLINFWRNNITTFDMNQYASKINAELTIGVANLLKLAQNDPTYVAVSPFAGDFEWSIGLNSLDLNADFQTLCKSQGIDYATLPKMDKFGNCRMSPRANAVLTAIATRFPNQFIRTRWDLSDRRDYSLPYGTAVWTLDATKTSIDSCFMIDTADVPNQVDLCYNLLYDISYKTGLPSVDGKNLYSNVSGRYDYQAYARCFLTLWTGLLAVDALSIYNYPGNNFFNNDNLPNAPIPPTPYGSSPKGWNPRKPTSGKSPGSAGGPNIFQFVADFVNNPFIKPIIQGGGDITSNMIKDLLSQKALGDRFMSEFDATLPAEFGFSTPLGSYRYRPAGNFNLKNIRKY